MRFRLSVILIALFLIPFLSSAQSGRIRDLYRYVEQTDSLADKSTKTFYLEKFLKDNYNYRETWRYLADGDRIVYFQVDYILDSTEFTEVYYVNRNRLVCSEEYEKVNYTIREDELKFGGIYYFESSSAKHVVTLGRKNYQYRNNDPVLEVLTRFGKRYSELKRHLPMLPDETPVE
ncbi:MAG: hypothetical protein JNK79_00650 [Chitinophagaceae bacterium]|nr:hypothetical protein [Chitinophagaceae bacterium]